MKGLQEERGCCRQAPFVGPCPRHMKPVRVICASRAATQDHVTEPRCTPETRHCSGRAGRRCSWAARWTGPSPRRASCSSCSTCASCATRSPAGGPQTRREPLQAPLWAARRRRAHGRRAAAQGTPRWPSASARSQRWRAPCRWTAGCCLPDLLGERVLLGPAAKAPHTAQVATHGWM